VGIKVVAEELLKVIRIHEGPVLGGTDTGDAADFIPAFIIPVNRSPRLGVAVPHQACGGGLVNSRTSSSCTSILRTSSRTSRSRGKRRGGAGISSSGRRRSVRSSARAGRGERRRGRLDDILVMVVDEKIPVIGVVHCSGRDGRGE